MRNEGKGRSLAEAGLILLFAGVSIVGQADLGAAPRYDGAGYSVLALAIGSGQGYRAIDHPDRPRHGHFPPGYPIALALLWRVTGPSARAAQIASCVFSLLATLLGWRWFHKLYPAPIAFLMGLALAVNWIWSRSASTVQSEPLFLLLSMTTTLLAVRAGRDVGRASLLALGSMLAACVLTRHVAVALAIAILLDLVPRRGARAALLGGATALLGCVPWIIWLGIVAGEGRSQASLMFRSRTNLLGPIAAQCLFYAQRIPDQLIGPVVEVATVFRGSGATSSLATVAATAASAIVVLGWLGCLRSTHRRLAGLVPLVTLGLLLVWPYTEAGRFLIPLIPCVLIGATEGGALLIRTATRGRRWVPVSGFRSPVSARLCAAGLILGASIPYTAYLLIRGKNGTRVEVSAALADFDAACRWISDQGRTPGPVLTRHPGEVFWQTGRLALEVTTSERPGDQDADPEAVEEMIRRYAVAFLLVDDGRYANAPAGPLARYARTRPERLREEWRRERRGGSIVVYRVLPPGS